MSVAFILRKVGHKLAKHAPEILTGLSAGGTIGAVIFTIKATPKAQKLIEEKKKELGVEKLSKWQTVKTCWKVYIPTGLSVIAGVGGAVGANRAGAKQQKELVESVARRLTDGAVYQCNKKIDEMLNTNEKPKEEQALPQKKNLTMIGAGRYLWKFYGVKFYATTMDVLRAENRLNKRMYGGLEMTLSIGEVCYELDIDPDMLADEITEMRITMDDGVEFIFDPFIDDTTGEPGIEITLACDPISPHEEH